MGRLRATLFEPSTRYDVDVGSRRGLLAGVFQAGLHLIGFASLFVLAILLGVIGTGGPGSTSTVLFWLLVIAGAGTGVGLVRLARVDRIDRFWRTIAGRLFTVLAVYGAFWGLLVTVGVAAVFAGIAFLGGRLFAHFWRYRGAGY